MRRFWPLALISFMAFLILFPVPYLQAAEKRILARFSIAFPPKHHLVRAANLFAKSAGEKSQSAIKIEVFPASQLYKEMEIIPAISTNSTKSVEIGDIHIERVAAVGRVLDIFGTNLYLVTDYGLTWKIADGRVGAYFSEALKKHGVFPILWSCSGAYNGITNTVSPSLRRRTSTGC